MRGAAAEEVAEKARRCRSASGTRSRKMPGAPAREDYEKVETGRCYGVLHLSPRRHPLPRQCCSAGAFASRLIRARAAGGHVHGRGEVGPGGQGGEPAVHGGWGRQGHGQRELISKRAMPSTQ